MKTAIPFVSLGLLVGLLIGMTASSVVATTLPLFFAFAGGSIIAFLDKLGDVKRRVAYAAVTALSWGCIFGIVGGVLITEHQWLSPTAIREARGAARDARGYLRSGNVAQVNSIDGRLRNGLISEQQAYDELLALVQSDKFCR